MRKSAIIAAVLAFGLSAYTIPPPAQQTGYMTSSDVAAMLAAAGYATPSQVNDAVAAYMAANPPASAILSGTYTVATNPTCNSGNARKYAWDSDLMGGPGDYVICDGAAWKPVRPLATVTAAVASMTLTALLTPPTVILTGVTNAVTFSASYAYKGARFRVMRKASGLGALIVNGIGINLNAWADFEFDGTTWVETASGGIL